jgi:hypothetical protein
VGGVVTTIAPSISSWTCFESVPEVQLASVIDVIQRVVFAAMVTLRVVDFVLMPLCTTPSFQVMENGAVPKSVTGMVMVPGPQIESFVGTLADGGELIGMVFEIVVDDDPHAQVSVMTTLRPTLPEAPEVNVTFGPVVPEVNTPFVIDHEYEVPPVALAAPGLFAQTAAGAFIVGATPGGGERTVTVVEPLAEQLPEVIVTV